MIVAITGVSGSGKSTLVHDVIYNGLQPNMRTVRAGALRPSRSANPAASPAG